MIFEHKVKGSFPIKDFEDDLRKHPFVKNLEIFPFTSSPIFDRGFNHFLAIKAKLAPILPSMFETKLTQRNFGDEKTLSNEEKFLISQCTKGKLKSEKPIVVVNIIKKNDSNSDMDKYNNAVVMNMFPTIGSRLFVSGKPESEYWNTIALIRYQSREKLCEMALSEEYAKVLPYKQNGLVDTHTYLTAAVLSYQRDLL